MGIVIGKFRKKKTTLEALETLEKEIKSIEDYRRSTEQFHKKIVGRFILLSVIVYLLAAFLFYFYFFPASLYERLYYIIPLILAPVIIISVKRVLTWYYNRKISKKQNRLLHLKDEKKKILEKVMDTETYKIAKTILEKFAPEQIRKGSGSSSAPPSEITPYKPRLHSVGVPTPQTLRHRALLAQKPSLPATTPLNRSSFSSVAITSSNVSQATLQQTASGIPGSPLPLPRAILPRERSVLDKMVEYLVGDGPSNRYALICKQCCSHNGMALPEEFEYVSYRCCYCYTFNPARKKRPAAPKLEYNTKTPSPTRKFSDTSDSEKISDSNTDSESGDAQMRQKNIVGKMSDAEKTSDFDKLSDFEFKTSDTETAPLVSVENVADTKVKTATPESESIVEGASQKPEEDQKD